MKLNRKILIVIGAVFLCVFCSKNMPISDDLHPVYEKELTRLVELWNILDQHSESIWPGWTTYSNVPFIFEYENMTRLAVGFKETPQGFAPVREKEIKGKKVYLDRRNEIPLDLKWPLSGGGGIRTFQIESGTQVPYVHITLTMNSERENPVSDNQILIYIHELFHVFQGEFYTVRGHGNIRYNPDSNYAVYSEIEGRALIEAFDAEDKKSAEESVKDFIVARRLKYKSMAPLERIQEKEEDFREGTARYSEYAALLQMEKSYNPEIDPEDDPYFHGFADLKSQFEKRRNDIKRDSKDTFGSRSKCYQYGCFQALLLNRFRPGWQKSVPNENIFLYDMLEEYVGIGSEEEKKIARRLNEKYDIASLKKNHIPKIKARNRAHESFAAREGETYIINFKPINEYLILSPRKDSKSFTLGRRSVFTKGIEDFQIKNVEFKGTERPILKEQLYHLKYIDTDNTGYTVASESESGGVHKNAVIKTSGFILKAPEVQIKERSRRVKFIVLSKIEDRD